jgi:hypothetical protein
MFPLRNRADPANPVCPESSYTPVIELIGIRKTDEIDGRHKASTSE